MKPDYYLGETIRKYIPKAEPKYSRVRNGNPKPAPYAGTSTEHYNSFTDSKTAQDLAKPKIIL